MRFFVLSFLLVSFSVFAEDEKLCLDLKKSVLELDKEMASLSLDAATCGQEVPTNFSCKKLSAVDLALQKINNEIALYNGVQFVKLEIAKEAASQEKISKDDIARINELDLNLRLARSIEGFVSFTGEAIKKTPPDTKKPLKLMDYYLGFCEQESKPCELPKDSPLAHKYRVEFKGLIELADNAKNSQLTVLENLAKEIEIRQAGAPSSYAAIFNKIAPNDQISVESVERLQSLPVIENVGKNDFRNITKDAKFLKENPVTVLGKFKKLGLDLKERQELQMKAKITLVLSQYSSTIPENLAGACKDVFSLTEKNMQDCFAAMTSDASKIYGHEKAGIENVLEGLLNARELNLELDKCILDKDLVSSECVTGLVSRPIEALTSEAAELEALKAKIIDSKKELINFKAIAMQKIEELNCMQKKSSKIVVCGNEASAVSEEVVALSNEAEQIVLLMNPPKTALDAAALCATQSLNSAQKSICETIKISKKAPEAAPYVPTNASLAKEYKSGPINSPNAPKSGIGSLFSALSGAAPSVFQSLMSQPMPMQPTFSNLPGPSIFPPPSLPLRYELGRYIPGRLDI